MKARVKARLISWNPRHHPNIPRSVGMKYSFLVLGILCIVNRLTAECLKNFLLHTFLPKKHSNLEASFEKWTYFCIADGDKNQVSTFIVVSQAPPAITCLRQQNFLQFLFCIIASQISFGHESGQKLKVSTVSQNTKADVLYDMLQFEIYEVSFEFINPWKVKTRRSPLLPQPHFSNIDFLGNW